MNSIKKIEQTEEIRRFIKLLQATDVFRDRFQIEEGKFEHVSIDLDEQAFINGHATRGVETASSGQLGTLGITTGTLGNLVKTLKVIGHELSHIKWRDYELPPVKLDVYEIVVPVVTMIIMAFLAIYVFEDYWQWLIGLGVVLAVGSHVAIKKLLPPKLSREREFRSDWEGDLAITEVLLKHFNYTKEQILEQHKGVYGAPVKRRSLFLAHPCSLEREERTENTIKSF